MSPVTLLLAFLVTAGCLFALRPVALRVGLLDIPGGRKLHKRPTPMTGGLGIYLGLLSISLLSPVILDQYLALLMISAFVLIVGILDDLGGMRVSLRFAFHGIAAWLMIDLAGVQLHSLGNLFFNGPVLITGVVSVAITIFAVIGVINAINMSDGLDGLSGGLVVIALSLLSIAALAAGETAMLGFNQLLITGVLAFLVLNFRLMARRSALVYLGDAGSTLLGFILAWLLIAASQGPEAFISPVYALWFVAVPLIDTITLLIQRPLRGSSPFRAGRDHLHHRLLEMGFNRHQTVLILYGVAALLGSIGLTGHLLGVNESLMFLLFLVLFAMNFRYALLRHHYTHKQFQ
ncbi:MAG: hypothetical protein WEB57_05485 [Pseudohongiellaceae bacterium]